jgi:dysferlin
MFLLFPRTQYPGHKQENKHDVPALLRIKLWLGLQSEEDAWHQMQKEGEMAVFAETVSNLISVPLNFMG